MLQRMSLVFCLVVGFAQAETYPVSAFDGSTPQLGLFGEQIPQSFYTENLQEAYTSGENFTTQFTKRNLGLNLYLINETDTSYPVVIHSANTFTGAVKNYLIDLPAGSSKDILYDGYSKLTIIASGEFAVQTSVGVLQNGAFTTTPVVSAPTPTESLSGTCHPQKRFLEIQNLAPSAPGRAVAYGFLSYTTAGGYKLNVYYPVYPKLFHSSITPVSCGATDILDTRSASGRTVRWTGIIKQMIDVTPQPPALLECISATAPDSCNVSGTTTPARWTAVKKGL